ncbi:RNA polymerase subunit sigma-70 [Ramlibacter sp. G-1-2-2]|uniref:RNA polymerase subunit sigma-70 n=1 Tax=Ramlibacter agri TaxID=2728837 RepID=A0A848HDL6_9BURK|nr:anti-sigma factor [Ramlibacter agri]NML45648.1 RNA polymerase subunit sigma-70 [Ramlibacter agri]
MNILERPELIDRLAAAYALGTLRGPARRRFETMARNSPRLRLAARTWQERLVSLTELQPGEAPDPNVWKRIENLVAAERRAVVPAGTPSLPERVRDRVSRWWRAGALAAGAAAVAALAVSLQLTQQMHAQRTELAALQAQPAVRYVAVLTDDRAQPAMLVTLDPARSTATLKRVAAFQEGPEKSLQLWGLVPGEPPHSLGVLGDGPVLRLPIPRASAAMPALAISLEPKGGVPGERGPTGPVLWKGAVLQAPV